MSQNEAGQDMEWSIFPFMEDLKRSIIVVVVILVCGLLVYLAFKDVFLALLSVLILFVSLHTYFSKTTYRLDRDGVVIRTSLAKTVKKWSDFKRYHADRKGVTLSPFAKPSRLEPFRSVRLLYKDNKDDVVEFISTNIGGPTPTDAG
ncbi:MAG: hypothetical protein ABIJ00_02305 [Candidatus Eisenbacteria bacterium]